MKRSNITILIFIIGVFFSITSISFTKKETQKERLLQISEEYKAYARYDNTRMVITDSAAWNWTISLCTTTPQTSPYKSSGTQIIVDSLHISKPNMASSPHGNKLYKLFVQDIKSYRDTTLKFQPLGQVIVKETWNVKAVSKDSVSKLNASVKQSMNDGNWYSPTTVSELFIMYKEHKSENNDEGWVYGIINLEDKIEAAKILEKGKISSCIGCHSGTKYDRIFGGK